MPASAETTQERGGALGRGQRGGQTSAVPAFLIVLGALIGWLAGTVLRIRRAHVEQAMVRAGIAPSFAPSMYRSLGQSLVELAWLARHPETPASELAELDEPLREALARADAQGRGVVIATAHAGNWELAAAAIAERHPLTVVAKAMHVGWVNRVCHEARAARRIAVAAPEGALTHARRALRRGGWVAMVIDQVPDRARHSLATDFLGASADVDRSPAALAAAMRAPLVVAAARRVKGAGQRLELLMVREPPAQERRAWIDATTRDATLALDRFVRAHPSEWLWMHRRWRHPVA